MTDWQAFACGLGHSDSLKSAWGLRGYEACTAQTSSSPAYSIYVHTELLTEHIYIEGRSRFFKILIKLLGVTWNLRTCPHIDLYTASMHYNSV